MDQIRNLRTMLDQMNVDKKRVNATRRSNKLKVDQSLSGTNNQAEIVGKGGKFMKDMPKRENAQEDARNLTRGRQEHIKEHKADNITPQNAWRLAVQKVRDENPGISYREALVLASEQYGKNMRYK